MFERILPELVKQRRSEKADETLILPDGREAIFDKEGFAPITPKAIGGRILFVDGGNAPVFESPAARVEFVRVYGTAYEGVTRVSSHREEGFILIRNMTKERRRYVEATGHGLRLSLRVQDDDKELRLGRERVSLAAIASLARFALECRSAGAWGEGCSLIVRDGSLLPNNSHEERELQELLKKNAAGLSKTNTLVTTSGSSASALLLEQGPERPWLYEFGSGGNIQFSLVKLHERAEHTFRLDTNGDAGAIAAGLALLAADPVFRGYPYPLVEADRMARVQNRELEGFRTRLMVEAGASWPELRRLARGSDSHAILDRIS
jgi:hypothetical protein